MVANRNARRREQYKQKKTQQQPFEASLHNLFRGTFQEKTNGELYRKNGAMETVPELNITIQKHAGHLVDINYLSETEVSGVINHRHLDEDSYLEFGFNHPGEVDDFSTEDASDLSAIELENYSDEERDALRFFTSNEYEWVNSTLYGETSVVPAGEDAAEGSFFKNLREKKGADAMNRYYFDTTYEERTDALLKEAVGLLDGSLAKTPGAPRVLYRGMNNENVAFDGLSAEEWVDSSLSLGQELMFDGYQSTSARQSVARNFAKEDGLLYEIFTPEGVNMNDVSEWDNEAEVLLPRKSRYMVVGIHHETDIGEHTMTVVRLVAINNKGEALNSQNRHVTPELKDSDFTVED